MEAGQQTHSRGRVEEIGVQWADGRKAIQDQLTSCRQEFRLIDTRQLLGLSPASGPGSGVPQDGNVVEQAEPESGGGQGAGAS
jgi:hypothetical protein